VLLRLLAAASILLPACQAPPAESRALTIDLSIDSYTLDNGLEVILRKDDRVPLVAVNLWYHVGAADDGPGRIGFAHLFEHMMLQGSRHVPGDPFSLLEAAGASAVDGNTDVDRTTYFEDLPSNQLELALWLESDRMGYLLDTLDEMKLSTQKSVVRNERLQTREAAPYGMAQEQILRLLFPAGHPYAAGIIGSHEDIGSARLEDMQAFFRRFYGPNNASLAVAGNIDIDRTKALIEKYFGSLPRGAEPPRRTAEAPRISKQRRAVLTDRVELPSVYLTWLTPAAYEEGDAEAVVAARMLGGGRSSRLHERLVFDRKIAQSVTASQRSLAQGSIFQIVATAKPGRTAQELENAIQAEIDLLAAEGPSERELTATKKGILAVTVKSLETLGVVADRLNSYNHYLGDPDYVDEDLKRYSAVTAGRLKTFIERHLGRERSVVVTVEPGAGTPPPPPIAEPVSGAPAPLPPSPEPWRAEIPKPGPAPAVEVPVADRFHLRNGLAVFHVPSGALPLVTAYLSSPFGSSSDPPDRPGLAGFTAAMLDEGSPNRGSVAIQRDLGEVGATIETGANREETWMVVQALTPELPKALSILSESARAPSFRASDVDRVRDNLIVSIRQQRDDKLEIAHKVLWRELYGEQHPYGHSPSGTEEALNRIDGEALKEFHAGTFTPRRAVLMLVGDLSRTRARRLAESAFGDWQGPSGPAAALLPPSPGPERVLIVDKPGSPQTALVLGQLGTARASDDYERVLVLNQVLGGLFSSRLNQNLREVKGYTYGLDSSQLVSRGPGPFRTSTMVDAQSTGSAVAEILREVEALKVAGITPAELALSRDSLAQSLPALFQTNGAIASTVAGLHLFGLPRDYYAGRAERLGAITLEQIRSLARSFLLPESTKVIAVGDRAVIEPQLRQLNLGPIGFRNQDGAP
jgi:zinc protease